MKYLCFIFLLLSLSCSFWKKTILVTYPESDTQLSKEVATWVIQDHIKREKVTLFQIEEQRKTLTLNQMPSSAPVKVLTPQVTLPDGKFKLEIKNKYVCEFDFSILKRVDFIWPYLVIHSYSGSNGFSYVVDLDKKCEVKGDLMKFPSYAVKNFLSSFENEYQSSSETLQMSPDLMKLAKQAYRLNFKSIQPVSSFSETEKTYLRWSFTELDFENSEKALEYLSQGKKKALETKRSLPYSKEHQALILSGSFVYSLEMKCLYSKANYLKRLEKLKKVLPRIEGGFLCYCGGVCEPL